jgi:predicted ATPase
MIKTFRARDYGCLLDVTASLTPLHAFIGPNDSGKSTLLRWMRTASAARLVRFDPDALRKPSGQPGVQSGDLMDERGFGLPGVYFALRSHGDDVFSSIVVDVRRCFKAVQGLSVKAVTPSTIALEVELQNGARVSAEHMSKGLLCYLAFAALRHLQPASLLLVEEPENGFHPVLIREVIKILRAIVNETGTQVVLTTHSPLVINELEPEEVSIVTRTEEAGTKVTPIVETHNFAKRSTIYSLGELWLSYANGIDEEPLLHGREPPSERS